MFITKETKWHPMCCCHDNSFAAGPVLIKTEIPSFCLNQEPSTPANLMMRVKTMSVPSRTLCPTLRGWKWGCLVFDRKRLEPREFPWQRHYGCHLVSFVMYISGAKFQEHYFSLTLLQRWQLLWAAKRAWIQSWSADVKLTALLQVTFQPMGIFHFWRNREFTFFQRCL